MTLDVNADVHHRFQKYLKVYFMLHNLMIDD